MPEPLLAVEGVRAGYGAAVVLDEVSLEVAGRDSLAVLGRNGVGKTTLLLTLMGFTNVMRGTIRWRGEDITALPPHRRARLGLGWVAQEREIFPSLSVEENLIVAARPGAWNLRAVYDLFPRLAERKGNMGNQLSGGEQQMLAIARCLMMRPKLIILDEPTEGIMPRLVSQIRREIHRINQSGVSILLVEQNVETALKLCPRVFLMEKGTIVHSGASHELKSQPEIVHRYLGLSH